MGSVVVYGRRSCPYTAAAEQLLQSHGISFESVDIDAQPEKRAEMIQRSGGRRTTPQVFFGQRHIGGSDDLRRAAERGALDNLVRAHL